jgi:hypothetical protein
MTSLRAHFFLGRRLRGQAQEALGRLLAAGDLGGVEARAGPRVAYWSLIARAME